MGFPRLALLSALSPDTKRLSATDGAFVRQQGSHPSRGAYSRNANGHDESGRCRQVGLWTAAAARAGRPTLQRTATRPAHDRNAGIPGPPRPGAARSLRCPASITATTPRCRAGLARVRSPAAATGTPYAEFGLSDAARELRMGCRLAPAGGRGFTFLLDATRHESAGGVDPETEHRVGFGVTASW